MLKEFIKLHGKKESISTGFYLGDAALY